MGGNIPVLQTERLILREFARDDLEDFFKIFRDEEANTFLPWFPVKTLEEARAFFAERYESPFCGCRYAVCRKEDGRPVGYVNVSFTGGHDFGYGLLPEFWGRGIMTEAGRAVIAQLRRDGVDFITATHDRNNPRSGAVMRRLGMRYCYSYEEQWQPKNFPVIFRMYQLNLDGQEDRVYRGYWDSAAVRMVEEGLGPDFAEKS